MKTVEPKYRGNRNIGEGNFGPAYFGFSYRNNNIFSKGISIFTKEEYDGIVPSHSFIVRDESTIVEASAPEVHIKNPKEYFDDPHIIVFFKKPQDLTNTDIETIVFNATLHIGRRYDYSLFGYYLLRWLEKRLSWTEHSKAKPSFFDTADSYLCSELCSYVLKSIPKYANLFPLSEYHPSKIDPVMLFNSEIFQSWSFDD